MKVIFFKIVCKVYQPTNCFFCGLYLLEDFRFNKDDENVTGTRELLRKPGQSKDDIGLLRTMIAGAAGGVVLWTVIFPSDVIKSRIQISNKKLKFLTVGYEIIQKEGMLWFDLCV